MKINQTVQTPNGPGRLVSTYRLAGDDIYGPCSGVLVKHAKDLPFDETLCAELIARAPISGALAVYRQEDISE